MFARQESDSEELPPLIPALYPSGFYIPSGISGDRLTPDGRLFDDDQVKYIEHVIKEHIKQNGVPPNGRFSKKLFDNEDIIPAKHRCGIIRTTNNGKLEQSAIYNQEGKEYIMGQGGFGAVKLACSLEKSDWQALKTQTIYSDEDFDSHQEEANKLKSFKKLLGDPVTKESKEKKKHNILMQYERGVNVQQLIKENDIPISMRLEILMKACVFLNENFHKKNMAHKDFRTANFLFDKLTSDVVLIDYGSAAELNEQTIKHDSYFIGRLIQDLIGPDNKKKISESLGYDPFNGLKPIPLDGYIEKLKEILVEFRKTPEGSRDNSASQLFKRNAANAEISRLNQAYQAAQKNVLNESAREKRKDALKALGIVSPVPPEALKKSQLTIIRESDPIINKETIETNQIDQVEKISGQTRKQVLLELNQEIDRLKGKYSLDDEIKNGITIGVKKSSDSKRSDEITNIAIQRINAIRKLTGSLAKINSSDDLCTRLQELKNKMKSTGEWFGERARNSNFFTGDQTHIDKAIKLVSPSMNVIERFIQKFKKLGG